MALVSNLIDALSTHYRRITDALPTHYRRIIDALPTHYRHRQNGKKDWISALHNQADLVRANG